MPAHPPEQEEAHIKRHHALLLVHGEGPYATVSGFTKPQKHQELHLLPESHLPDEKKKVGLDGRRGTPVLEGPQQLLLTYVSVGRGACEHGSRSPSRVR